MAKVLGLLIAMIAAYLANGLAISKMWQWFIVPTFNAPPLSIPVAIGIGMLVGMMTVKLSKGEKDEAPLWSKVGAAILSPLFTLFVAWIVSLFV